MAVCTVQVGFLKGYKEKQYVGVFINNKAVTWVKGRNGSYNGEFVTPMSKRQNSIWFLARCECSQGDVIRLETKIFTPLGPDEDRTRVSEWVIDEDVEPTEHSIAKVGHKDFPLLSGKIVLLQSKALIEERLAKGDDLISESKE